MLKKVGMLLVAAIFIVFSLGVSRGEAASPSQFIIINKSINRLAYYENGKLVKTFKVGTGKVASYTPEGKFKIVNKIVNRPYYTGNIPGGDSRNPLGNRWLGLNARGTWGTTYAIHGNNNPSSIGHYVSSGCIRMYDEEVEWLFSKVKVNTPVLITSSAKSFDDIAKANGFSVTKSKDGSTTVVTATTLKKGSKGNEVKALQQKLKNLGYNPKGVDGVFGANTDKAVRAFQKAKGLTTDGVVGTKTKAALGLK